MESKYYAYYKPDYKVDLMNNIKTQLLEEYDSLVVTKLMSQIFNNINNNDTDEFLCHNKYNALILIKFSLVNHIFIKQNNIDKSNYTLVSKTVDWIGKKTKNNNYNQHYTCDKYSSYFDSNRSILFNGSTNNPHIDDNTQYIFTEYLLIDIATILKTYKNIKFDTQNSYTNNKSQFLKSLLKYEQFNSNDNNNNSNSNIDTESYTKLTDKNIKNILILLNTILASENVVNDRNYFVVNKYNNENLLSKKIVPYTNENDDLVICIWNTFYKQPENVYDVFDNYKLIIDNTMNYKSGDLRDLINIEVYSYLYITQKKFSELNYKDALPLRLAFDTTFRYDGKEVYINYNKEVDDINKHQNEINKFKTIIEKLTRTNHNNQNSILRNQENINYHEGEILNIKSKLSKIDPYYKKHLLFHTNIGLKLTYSNELNGYKSLLYLRYLCNNYDRLNYNKLITNKQTTNNTQTINTPDFMIIYDNVTDKRNDIFEFYVSKVILNDIISKKLNVDLFSLSRLFSISTDHKYQDGKYNITNHEINKSYEVEYKTSIMYKKLSQFLDNTINLNLFEYQKNNLLWMLELEDNIDKNQINIDTYFNKYRVCGYDVYNELLPEDIKSFIYNLRSHIPEVLTKNYMIHYDNQKYMIDIKNNDSSNHMKSIIASLNANNNKRFNKSGYNFNFNIIEDIIKPKEYKDKYNKQINFCGGAICDEVGLGKTLTIISHLVIKLKHDMLKYYNYKKDINDFLKQQSNKTNTDKKDNENNNETFIDPLDKGFEFNNLIIVPSRLTSQWESEIEKYVKDKFNLRAKVLIGINSIKTLEKELKEFNITKSKKQNVSSNTQTTNITTDKKLTKKIIFKPNYIIKNNTSILQKEIIDGEGEGKSEGEGEGKSEDNKPITNTNTNTNNNLSNTSLKKLTKEQKIIEKLMLKAKKNNEKLEKKKLVKLNKKNVNKDIIDNDVKDDDVKDDDKTKINTFDSLINNLTELDNTTKTEDIVNEEIVNEEIVNEDDNYYFADKYLKCHKTNTEDIENDYILDQLYDIYIVSINLLSNENYLKYIEHDEHNHLNQYYEGETESIMINNKIKSINNYYKEKENNYKASRLTDKFNIFKIKWNRVILDEAHEKLSPTVKLFTTSVFKYIFPPK